MCQKYGFSLTRIFPYKFTSFCYIKNYFSNTNYYTTAALLSITISTGASMSAFGQNRFYFLSFTTNELKVVLVVDIFTQIFHCFFKLRKRTLSMQDARGFESFSNFSKKKKKNCGPGYHRPKYFMTQQLFRKKVHAQRLACMCI